jgi:hydroxymethylpyrimidine/phosphomethylpyrimidine kinase
VPSRGHRQRRRIAGRARRPVAPTIVANPTPNIEHRAPNIERAVPVALTIAGSDSSAGAGAQADVKTFSALGVYGLNAITCVVAEMPRKVARIQDIGPDIVGEQLEILLKGFPIAAIKTGMLYSGEIISIVARTLSDRAKKIPLVVDPVMVATSGDTLLQPDAIAFYERELFPRASLITPNLDEAAKLEKYRTPVLLKGGHLMGNRAMDLFFFGDKVVEFSAPFVRGISTHGTGCTYSAAITAGLARGLDLEESIGRAKKFVSATIAQHFQWKSKARSAIHALNHSPDL